MREGADRSGTARDDLPGLPAWAFLKRDPTPDPLFYASPRFVTHIDGPAIAAVTGLYRAEIPPGAAVLDLMSSWVSHLPADVAYAEVVGHGLNAAELAANLRLTRSFVRDLNAEPALPLADASLDAATLCVSVQYLERPVVVLRDLLRVLRPGAPVLVTVSNRCFPTKAVAIWTALSGDDRARLVARILDRAGFADVEIRVLLPEGGPGDPLTAILGRAPRPAPISTDLAQDGTGADGPA